MGCLDLAKLGFGQPGSDGGAGQPAYNPADLLKLYLYGYLNRIRSSRRLEREAGRNLELIWLMQGLVPGYRTIAKFRKDNWAALKAANRDFVLVVRELGLVGGALVAIDGTFMHGDAGRASITTHKKLAERLATLDRDIEAYGATLTANDAAEAAQPQAGETACGEDIAQKVAALMERRMVPTAADPGTPPGPGLGAEAPTAAGRDRSSAGTGAETLLRIELEHSRARLLTTNSPPRPTARVR